MAEPLEPDDDVAAALRRLPREMRPPSHVRANLRADHRSNPRASLRFVLRAAIAASIVVAAFTAGRLTAPRPASPAGQKFAFLLYGGATGGGDDRAAEYGTWAAEARRGGRAVSGERLADAAFVAGSALADPAPVRGFFIVHARDAQEALDLARRHPHARDGTIVVRPIDTP
jgi:hypothetical protein